MMMMMIWMRMMMIVIMMMRMMIVIMMMSNLHNFCSRLYYPPIMSISLDFLEGCDWYFGAYARNLQLQTSNHTAPTLGEVVDRVPEVSHADTVDALRSGVQKELKAGED